MSEDGPLDGLFSALRRLDFDFRSQHVPWALVGGIAIALRVLPRTTEDVDVILAVSGDEETQRIAGFLISRGWRPEREFNNQHGQIASMRMRGPGRSDIILDLLVAATGIEAEVAASAEPVVVVQEIEMPVATVASLLALKILAGRDKDRQDIEALVEAATPRDIRDARRLLELIERRGFDRDKDLLDALDQLLVGAGRPVVPSSQPMETDHEA